ncbi:hypothetical protein [uncultured Paraglaciecola sp.]|uniref:hypothetical protein n=1 Tax=uncultured Paraglaciecola sp. TaxID=1765024 RepID=UPI00261B5CF8|nr:hypothetical protein [uncultured Paraglaciecola sp.]
MTQTVYVNTDNSSSGDGTTNEVDGSADSAWVNLQAAISDLPATFTDDIVILCEGTVDDTSTPDFDGYNINGFSLTVIGDYSGFGWNADEYIISSTNSGELSVNTDVIIKNIQCENTGTNNTRFALQTNLAASESVRFENSIFRITGTGGTSSFAVSNADPTAVSQRIWVNCTFINPLNDAFTTAGSTDGGDVLYNCNAHDSASDGFLNISSQAIIKNCLGYNNTSKDYSGGGAHTGSTTNLSGDANAPGTSAILNASLTFEDAVNQDYRLVVGDTDAIGAATDLSADAIFAFDYDAAGNTRSSWDVGAHEYQAAGDSTPPDVSLPTATSITNNSVVIGGTTALDPDGVVHCLIVADGDEAGPSDAEIIAGNYASQVAVATDLTITAEGNFTFAAVTGLSGARAKTAVIVHVDSDGNYDSGSRQFVDFTLQSATVTFATDLISGTVDGVLFDDALENSPSVLLPLNGSPTNGSGGLVVDLNAETVTHGQAIEGIAKDRVSNNPIALQGTVSIA